MDSKYWMCVYVYSYGDEFNTFFLNFGNLYTFIIIINKNTYSDIGIRALFAKIYRELNSDEKVILSNTCVNNFFFIYNSFISCLTSLSPFYYVLHG